MNIFGLLLGNFLLFTLYACTPSLFKPTVKITYSRLIFAEILERCTWPMSKSANKSRKWKKLHFANIITGIYFKNSKRENGKETYSISMVGKKILLNDPARSTRIFWSINLEKKSAKKKERKKQGKKKAHSGFHPGFKHFSCAMISFLSSEVHINQAKIVTLKTSDINMTSEVCCVIWIINKRAHCVQLK